MYVCLCNGVTDNSIRGAVEEGARSWREVREATGCATQCGKCARVGKQITREAVVSAIVKVDLDLAYAI